jgi:hypothetical protein
MSAMRSAKTRAVSPRGSVSWSSWRYSCPQTVVAVLKRGLVGFAGPDADGVIERNHEDLAVADCAGFRNAHDGGRDLLDLVRCHRDFYLELRQEVHRVLGAAVNLGVTLLAAETLGLGDSKAMDADAHKRVPDLVELEWLDDGHDEFHEMIPLGLGGRERVGDELCRLPALLRPVNSSYVPTLGRGRFIEIVEF